MSSDYLSWTIAMITTPVKKRREWVELIFKGLHKFGKNGEGKYLANLLQDSSTWEIVGFSTNVHYILLDGSKEDLVKTKADNWNSPALLLKHHKLPIFVIAGPEVGLKGENHKINPYTQVKECLSWATTMLNSSVKRRKEWVKLIFESFKSYRKVGLKGENLKINPYTQAMVESKQNYLSDALQDQKTWDIIGFSVNLQYVRVSHADKNLLRFVFLHPWGTPPLLLKHKRMPMIVIAGAGIRWNDTILRELKENDSIIDHDLEGATG